MKKVCLYLHIAFLLANIVHAQSVEPGSEASSLGGSYVSQSSVFSSKHNPGALAFVKKNALGVGVRNNYLINNLNDFYLNTLLKTPNGAVAIDMTYYGFEAFQQTELGASYSHLLTQQWSAGVRLSYAFNYLPEEDVRRHLVSADFGILGRFKHWRVGASVIRFAQSKWFGYNQEKEAVIMRIGGGYYFSNQTSITGEFYKSTETKPDIRLGMNYKPIDELDLRIGFSTLQPAASFGVGISTKNLQINIAAAWHQQLGLSPVTDVVYEW